MSFKHTVGDTAFEEDMEKAIRLSQETAIEEGIAFSEPETEILQTPSTGSSKQDDKREQKGKSSVYKVHHYKGDSNVNTAPVSFLKSNLGYLGKQQADDYEAEDIQDDHMSDATDPDEKRTMQEFAREFERTKRVTKRSSRSRLRKDRPIPKLRDPSPPSPVASSRAYPYLNKVMRRNLHYHEVREWDHEFELDDLYPKWRTGVSGDLWQIRNDSLDDVYDYGKRPVYVNVEEDKRKRGFRGEDEKIGETEVEKEARECAMQ